MSPTGAGPDRAFTEFVAERLTDEQRLEAVVRSGLLDSPAETGFDRIAALAARLLATPYAFITVVDDARSFWKAAVGEGLAVRETTIEASFCQYVVGTDDAFLVDDAQTDHRTHGNPAIESMGVRAWAGVPLRAPGGEALGTVCVVDTAARTWGPDDAALLRELALIAADEIASQQSAAAARRSQALLEAVLAQAPIGFSLVNADLRYELVNEAMAAINGHPTDDHLGRTIGEMVPGVAEAAVALTLRVLDTGAPEIDIEITGETDAQSGIERTWMASYFRIEAGEEPIGVGTIVADVTERVATRVRAERLAEITRRLGACESTDEVVEVVTTYGHHYLGADNVTLGLRNDPEGVVTLGRSDGTEAEILARFDLSARDASPYGLTARTGATVFVGDREQRVRDFPATLPIVDATGTVASGSVPLLASDRRVFGVLVAGWERALADVDFPRFELETLADIAAQALERTRVFAERLTLVDSLQSSLLTPAPSIEGLEMAVRYQPAGDALGFGGDWYDIVEIDQDRVALIVGDVVGHDPIAAAHMTQIRTVVSSLVMLDTPLDRLFELAEQILHGRHQRIHATVGVSVVNTVDRTLTTVLAGHPPPLIARPDGQVASVEHSLRPLIGVSAPAMPCTPVAYEPGSTLLMFTDGLVETRGSTIVDDIDLLAKAFVARAGSSVDDIADGLLADFRESTGTSDDVALVIARL